MNAANPLGAWGRSVIGAWGRGGVGAWGRGGRSLCNLLSGAGVEIQSAPTPQAGALHTLAWSATHLVHVVATL